MDNSLQQPPIDIKPEEIVIKEEIYDFFVEDPTSEEEARLFQELNVKKYKCTKCEYRTDFLLDLIRHSKEHLGGNESQFNCSECRFNTPSLALLNIHRSQEHVISQFFCTKCNFMSNNIELLKKHLDIHKKYKKIESEIFKCGKCTFTTRFEYCYKRHIHYRTNDPKLLSIKNIKNKNNDDEVIIVYKCDFCPFTSKNKWYIRCHMKNKHSAPIDAEKRFKKCDFCDFKTMYNLKKHVLKHHTPDSECNFFQCEHCTYKSKDYTGLKYHLSSIHKIIVQNAKLHNCPHCEYFTMLKKSLAEHILFRHTDVTNVSWKPCSYCDYRSRNLSNLNLHKRRVHADILGVEKIVFRCTLCIFSTHAKKTLKIHLITKHTKEDLRFFNLYGINVDLLEKELTFYQCPHCQYGSYNKKYITKHIPRKHKEEIGS